jgi:hypothetical protein
MNIQALKAKPFHTLSAAEKQALIAATKSEAKQATGREASVKSLAASIMMKCR